MHQPIKVNAAISARGRAQLAQSGERIDAINKIARLIEADENNLVKHGIEFGRELYKLKRDVGHGHWKPLFLDGVFDFTVRTAQRYMRLYRKIKDTI